jgi:hypothetical protein
MKLGKTAASTAKVSPEGEEAVAVFKKNYPKPREGSSYDRTQQELVTQFNSLANVLQDQKAALTAVKNFPEVLTLDSKKVSDNFGKLRFNGKRR